MYSPVGTDSCFDRFITRTALRNRRLSSRDLRARFAGRYGIQISDQTVRNRLTQPISELIRLQEACNDGPSPSDPFALVSATPTLEPEHVGECHVQ